MNHANDNQHEFPVLHLSSSAPPEQAMAEAERHYDQVAIMRRNRFEDGLYAQGFDHDDVSEALRQWAEREVEAKAVYLHSFLDFLMGAKRGDWLNDPLTLN